MKSDEFSKTAVDNPNNFGIAFRITNSLKQYKIDCIFIEQGKMITLRCAPPIEDKNFAQYLLKIINNYWDTNNKILRFYDNPKGIKVTKYCEIRNIKELKEYFEQFHNNDNCELDELRLLESEINSLPMELDYLIKYCAQIKNMKCPKCGRPLRIIESGHPQYKNEICFTCTGYEKNKSAKNNCRFLIPVTPISYNVHKDKLKEFMKDHPSSYIAYSRWKGWEY